MTDKASRVASPLEERLGPFPWGDDVEAWLEVSDASQVAADILAYAAQERAAERERLLSMPNLMHACDALGAPADGEYCDVLRRALCRA